MTGEPETPLPLGSEWTAIFKESRFEWRVDFGRGRSHLSLKQPSRVHEPPPHVARPIAFRGWPTFRGVAFRQRDGFRAR